MDTILKLHVAVQAYQGVVWPKSRFFTEKKTGGLPQTVAKGIYSFPGVVWPKSRFFTEKNPEGYPKP